MNELYKRERCRPYWALSEVRRFWISRSCVNSVRERERVCVCVGRGVLEGEGFVGIRADGTEDEVEAHERTAVPA
jgi:hypothetical protein